jgi:hypothetical protein
MRRLLTAAARSEKGEDGQQGRDRRNAAHMDSIHGREDGKEAGWWIVRSPGG